MKDATTGLRCVVTDQAFGNTRHEAAAAAAGGAGFAEHQCREEAETRDAVEGAQVVLTNFAPITRNVLAALAPGGTVIRYGVGVDNVDMDAARALGIHVCNVPDYGVEEVADHAAAMTLHHARHLGAFDGGIRDGRWGPAVLAPDLRSLRDSTVGLLGMGRIARAYAARMSAFGCRIVGYDPYLPEQAARDAGIEPVSRESVLESAHILSLHTPLTPETRHMIDADALAALPKGAIVVNCSRGGLIDEVALAEALRSGALGGAGLDTFEAEPLPAESPLRDAPNLLLSPHAAFYSNASVDALQRLASEEALRALRGEPLRCPLT